MTKFRIIPVIDILNSVAVHAIKGERSKYKPIESVLVDSSNPIEVTTSFERSYGFQELYIADLDSILNKKPNIEIISSLLEVSSIKLMLDPGISNSEDLSTFSKLNLNNLILGLETLENLDIIDDALNTFGSKRIILSFDLYDGKVLTKIPEFKNVEPLTVIKRLELFGIKEIILLDIFRVGQKIGAIPPLFNEIKDNYNGNTLVGGGIKDFNDILNYNKLNYSGVLIATAIHDGSINIEKIRDFIKN